MKPPMPYEEAFKSWPKGWRRPTKDEYESAWAITLGSWDELISHYEELANEEARKLGIL